MQRRLPERDELMVWVYAACAYGLALTGAVGFAWLLGLDRSAAWLLVGAVAVIALFGSALPILRLGYRRLEEKRKKR